METFERVHAAQLQAIGFPARLLPRLFSKLTSKKQDDPEDVFQLTPSDNGRDSVCGRVLRCRRRLGAVSDVLVLRHLWSSDGGEGGRRALLDDPALLAEVAGWLGVPLPGERLKTAMEEMMMTVCEQTGKSKVVARKALTDSGYDLVAAVLQASHLSEEDVIAQRGQRSPSLTVDEFRKGLTDLRGGDGGREEIPEAQIQGMYEDWKDRKLREPERDAEDWVQCGRYKWKEEEEGAIAVSIPLPPNTKKTEVKSEMTSRRWRFAVKGSVLLEGEFCGRVVPDECFWTVEGGCVSVSVQSVESVESGGWGELLVGEVQGESVGVEETAVCAEEILSRVKQLNLTYSAVTNEGRFTPHPVVGVSNECPGAGGQPQVWYLMEPLGLALLHSKTPNFACHPFAK